MGKYPPKYLKPLGVILVALIVISGFIFLQSKLNAKKISGVLQQDESDNLALPEANPGASAPGALTLQVEGYGFTFGDIVQIKTKNPVVGDIIVYDPFRNGSMCMGMGPSMSLGKVLGLPGENFSFQSGNLKIRTETINLNRDYSRQKAVFGNRKYENLVDKNFTLQKDEYLLGQWAGSECFPGESDESGSVPYNRFTVNEKAVIGVVEKKIGHDAQAEQDYRNRVY